MAAEKRVDSVNKGKYGGRLPFGLALLSIALLSACGGGGSPPASTPTPAPAPVPTPAPTPAPAPTPSSFNTAEFGRSGGPSQHGALTAYNAGATGRGIVVGVVDGGINTNSAEFAGRIHPDSNDFAGSRGIKDEGGHGTAVSSVIAAAKNDTGAHGMAFDASLLVLRTDTPGSCATDDPNDPDDDGCSHLSSAIAAGINQARISGARVLNISLGGDSAGSQVRNAIASATAAGTIVVVSAGNDGNAAPDGFAAEVAASGNGLVIIAGSVGETNGISTFSNRAGTQAEHFLTALGERVRANDHEDTAFLWSGTSFSAPQISGAAALLAQAFPNLTGAQIVQLLLSSARDAGTAGADDVYGRGILDIAAAFQPRAGSSLAGTKIAVDPNAGGGQTSAAMGDAALQGQNVGAVILDGFDRAFALDLAQGIRAAAPEFRLTAALGGGQRHMSASGGGVQIAMQIGRSRAGVVDSRNLLLSGADAQKAELLAASVVTQLSPELKIAFGFRQGAGALVSKMQASASPAFLVAPSPAHERGFHGRAKSALAVRHEMGGFGLTVSAESGTAYVDSRNSAGLDYQNAFNRDRFGFSGLGLTLDRRLGRASLSLAANWLGESDTILGSRFGETIGASGAQSWFVDGRADFDLSGVFGDGWHSSASWRQGWTSVDRATLLAGGTLKTSSFAADISKTGLFGASDRIGFRFAQPLRVSAGGLNLHLPVGYNYQTGETTFGQRTLNLAPQGRELVSELTYGTALWGGYLSTNLFWRQEPGHFENVSDDLGGAVRFQLKF